MYRAKDTRAKWGSGEDELNPGRECTINVSRRKATTEVLGRGVVHGCLPAQPESHKGSPGNDPSGSMDR